MPSRFPPGPNDFAFGMRTMGWMKKDVLAAYSRLHRDYGDAVSFRTGPYRLFVFYHPDQVREVLVKHAKQFIRLPRVMKTFAQWNGQSILIAEGEPWIRQRRLVQPAFQPRRLQNYGRTMVDDARSLIASWENTIERDGHIDVDIDKAMTGLTLSVICRTMFDTEVDDIASEITEAVAVLSNVAFHEMQAPVRLPTWLPTRWNRRKRWAIDVLDRAVGRFVRERRADGRDHGDLLSMLLAAVDEESDGTRLDDRQVRDEATTLMLAGHDTTASALDWMWYAVARYPDVQMRCQAEIDDAFDGGEPNATGLERMPYLTAAIKETLRLYPPAVAVFLRQATADLSIGGYDVPKGSLVTLSSFVTHRDAAVVRGARAVRPRAFSRRPRGRDSKRRVLPVQGAARVCIGQSFAVTEMALVAATMLQRCGVERIDLEEPAMHVTMALRRKSR